MARHKSPTLKTVPPEYTESRDGLRVGGAKATTKIESPLDRIVDILSSKYEPDHPFYLMILKRFMSKEKFIQEHASGTLRKNARIGFDVGKQLLHERTAFDFGYGFECVHESHVNWGTALSEGDCHPISEAGWHIDRYRFVAFPGDEFETKYLKIHTGAAADREGVGIIVRKTSAPYVPNGYVVFAMIAEVNLVKHDYEAALNPC